MESWRSLFWSLVLLNNRCFQDDEDKDIDFEDLFSQLSKMKDISKNLPESERKAYAEKVAVAFYKSMGGSDSEEAEGWILLWDLDAL